LTAPPRRLHQSAEPSSLTIIVFTDLSDSVDIAREASLSSSASLSAGACATSPERVATRSPHCAQTLQLRHGADTAPGPPVNDDNPLARKLSQSVSHRRESGGTERPIDDRRLRGRRKRLWNPVCHVGYPEMTRSTTYATGNASGSAPDSVSARRKRRSVCDDTSHREHSCQKVFHDRVPYNDRAPTLVN
jgi:hypothetical protein